MNMNIFSLSINRHVFNLVLRYNILQQHKNETNLISTFFINKITKKHISEET